MPFTCTLCPKEQAVTAKSLQGLYSHVARTHKANWDDYVKQHGGLEKLKTEGGDEVATVKSVTPVKPVEEEVDDTNPEGAFSGATPKPAAEKKVVGQTGGTSIDSEGLEAFMESYLQRRGLVQSQVAAAAAEAKNNGLEDPAVRKEGGASEVMYADPSLILTRFWLRAKNAMWFDMAKNGAFSQEPLRDFAGNLSDFINVVIEDYFKIRYGAGLGIIRREAF